MSKIKFEKNQKKVKNLSFDSVKSLNEFIQERQDKIDTLGQKLVDLKEEKTEIEQDYDEALLKDKDADKLEQELNSIETKKSSYVRQMKNLQTEIKSAENVRSETAKTEKLEKKIKPDLADFSKLVPKMISKLQELQEVTTEITELKHVGDPEGMLREFGQTTKEVNPDLKNVKIDKALHYAYQINGLKTTDIIQD